MWQSDELGKVNQFTTVLSQHGYASTRVRAPHCFSISVFLLLSLSGCVCVCLYAAVLMFDSFAAQTLCACVYAIHNMRRYTRSEW